MPKPPIFDLSEIPLGVWGFLLWLVVVALFFELRVFAAGAEKYFADGEPFKATQRVGIGLVSHALLLMTLPLAPGSILAYLPLPRRIPFKIIVDMDPTIVEHIFFLLTSSVVVVYVYYSCRYLLPRFSSWNKAVLERDVEE